MPSIHFVCKPTEGGGHLNLSQIDPTHYKSGWWFFLPNTRPSIKALTGGWIYLHEEKKELSYIGGIILKIEEAIEKPSGRLAFTFEMRIEAKGQRWRGIDHDKAINSWIVESNFSHENAKAHQT